MYSLKGAIYPKVTAPPQTEEERIKEILDEVYFRHGPPEQVLNEGLFDWLGGIFSGMENLFGNLFGSGGDDKEETPADKIIKKAFNSQGSAFREACKEADSAEVNDQQKAMVNFSINYTAKNVSPKWSVTKVKRELRVAQQEQDEMIDEAAEAMKERLSEIRQDALELNDAMASAVQEYLGRANVEEYTSNKLEKNPKADKAKIKEQFKKDVDRLKNIADLMKKPFCADIAVASLSRKQLDVVSNYTSNRFKSASELEKYSKDVKKVIVDFQKNTVMKANARSLKEMATLGGSIGKYVKGNDFSGMAATIVKAAAGNDPKKYFSAITAANSKRKGG